MSLKSNNESKNQTIWRDRFIRSEFNQSEKPFTLDLSNKGVLRIKNKFNKTRWNFPRSKNLFKLESDGINTLRNDDILLSCCSNEWQLRFIDNQIKLFKNNETTQFNIFELGKDCRASKIFERVKSNELVLKNGKLDLYDIHDEIFCSIRFDPKNEPFKLLLNNQNGSIEIFNAKNEKVWTNKKEINLNKI